MLTAHTMPRELITSISEAQPPERKEKKRKGGGEGGEEREGK